MPTEMVFVDMGGPYEGMGESFCWLLPLALQTAALECGGATFYGELVPRQRDQHLRRLLARSHVGRRNLRANMYSTGKLHFPQRLKQERRRAAASDPETTTIQLAWIRTEFVVDDSISNVGTIDGIFLLPWKAVNVQARLAEKALNL